MCSVRMHINAPWLSLRLLFQLWTKVLSIPNQIDMLSGALNHCFREKRTLLVLVSSASMPTGFALSSRISVDFLTGGKA